MTPDMERLLEKQEQKKDDRYEINVGHQKFNFNCDDALFKLTAPIGENKGNKNCNTCTFKVSKGPKRQYCDFCGFLNCEKCMHKKRNFM